jgi:integrase
MARGSIKPRGKGIWTIVIDLPRGEDGKRKQKRITVRGRKEQAEKELTRVLNELDQGVPLDASKMTLADYLEIWLRDVVSLRNRPRTIDGYKTIVRKYLIPHVGRIQLAKLTAAHIEKMYARILEEGLSPNTAHHVHVCLSKALNDALRKGIVGRNVCKIVQPPSPGRYEVNIPEVEGIRRIIELAKETPYYAALHFTAYTGVRRAEVLALTWADVDLDRAFVSITKTLQRIGKNGLVVDPTKSQAGRRGIALDEGTIAVLRAHRGQQLLYKMQLGEVWNDGDLVFPGPFGKHLDPATLTRNFEKLACKAGYPGLRLHDLRHAHAAGMIKAGAAPLVVMERLGHASAAFTLNVYGHLSPGMQTEAAAAFAKLMLPKVVTEIREQGESEGVIG